MPDDTRRRQRRRLGGQAVSALEGIDHWERPQERLNAAVLASHCAWPDCAASLWRGGSSVNPDSNRYGLLCETHAVDVAIAVTQHQRDLQRMTDFFEQQSTKRAIDWAHWRAEQEKYEAEKAALRKDRDGFVYYIQIGAHLKIGFSKDVRRRMRSYPPESKLLAIEPGDKDLERSRHRQFKASLTHGREWFTPTVDLIEHIETVVKQHGEPPRSMAHHYGTTRQPMRVSRKY